MRRLCVLLAVSLLAPAFAGCGPSDADPNPALKRPEGSLDLKRPSAKDRGKAAEAPPKR